MREGLMLCAAWGVGWLLWRVGRRSRMTTSHRERQSVTVPVARFVPRDARGTAVRDKGYRGDASGIRVIRPAGTSRGGMSGIRTAPRDAAPQHHGATSPQPHDSLDPLVNVRAFTNGDPLPRYA